MNASLREVVPTLFCGDRMRWDPWPCFDEEFGFAIDGLLLAEARNIHGGGIDFDIHLVFTGQLTQRLWLGLTMFLLVERIGVEVIRRATKLIGA